MTNINVIEAVRSYINRMIEDCGSAIKGLVMDKETVFNTNNYFVVYTISSLIGFYCQYGLCSIRNSSKRSISFRTY